MRRFFTILAALFAFVGCSQDDVVTPNTPIEKPTYYASFADAEADSRTYLDENFMLLWHNDDRISLFATTYNEEYAFADATGSNSGAFNAVDKDSYVTGNAISTTYAVYPYNAANAISNSEILTIHFPAEQSYAEDSFGRGANTMVAAAQSSSSKLLPFRNAGGYMVLKLYGENKTVKSIELKGNNEEVISGAAKAEAKYGYLPLITMGAEGGKTITLTCQNAVELGAAEAEATTFWIVVPPITFEEGFTITVTDADGGTYTKSTSKPTTITRNEIKSMSALAPTFTGETENPETPTKPANNEIWYTATEKVVKNNWTVDTFGANITDHTFDTTTGKGIITFDGEVTEIGDYAFSYCSSLTSITIPDSVTEIGSSAFIGCTSLTSVTIPDSVTTIGSAAFSGCTLLTSVTIPDSVTSIGSSAFSGCTSLTSVTIPDSVTEIGVLIFRGCTSLTSVTIGNGVTEIGKEVFSGCTSLISVTIPNSVTEIGEKAFYSCTSLTSVTIPDSVTSIGYYAFYKCTSLTSITIPESVSTIESGSFRWCDNLKNVYLNPSTPPATGSYDNGYESNWRAFYQCNGVGITVPDEAYDKYIETEGWRYYAYFFLKQGEKLDDPNRISNRMIWYTNTNNTAISVQKYKWQGYNYWGDATMLFAHYDTYNKIGFLVFDKDLTAITEDSSVFYFNENTGSTTFTLPGSLVYIEPRSFYLASVKNFYGPLATQDNRAIVLGTTLNAYANENTATSYTIPEGITRIEDNAFEGWSYLRSVTIPDSVISIGKRAFSGSSQYLSQVNIGSGIENIGDYAFSGCNSLSKIYCKALTPPVLGADVFSSNASDRKFYVPYDGNYSTAYYENAEGWSEYKNYIYGTSSFEY